MFSLAACFLLLNFLVFVLPSLFALVATDICQSVDKTVESDFDRFNSRAKYLKGASEVDAKKQGDGFLVILRGLKIYN